jgi:GNAT superfamily N-acetyltransferase
MPKAKTTTRTRTMSPSAAGSRDRGALRVRVVPATPERWADLEQLFGRAGAYGGCWCMFFRQSAAEWKVSGSEPRRRALWQIVSRGEEPGVLAYAGDRPVGWCAVAPRAAYARLATSRLFPPLDDEPVWSVTCFFVAKDWRRRRVTVALLEGAAKLAKRHGARVLEGYPTAPRGEAPDPYVYHGTVAAFTRAGFEVVKRPSAGRALMRRVLRPAKAARPARAAAGSSPPSRGATTSPRPRAGSRRD